MQIIEMPYDRTNLLIDIPGGAVILRSQETSPVQDENIAIRNALRDPRNSPPLKEMAGKGTRVLLVHSDITRAVPNARLLPVILDELEQAGVRREDITLINALGSHRQQTRDETVQLLGDKIVSQYRCVQHNSFDDSQLESYGVSSYGHPIKLNKHLREADLVILTGFIEPHFFAGFSGGPKAILPGLAGSESILSNHGYDMIANPAATFNITHGNPIWEEMMEMASKVNPTFLVNVTLNKDHRITGVFAGDVAEAHKAGCEFLRQSALVDIESPFDVVITTNSGYPLDQNLYQCVKGLAAAKRACRQGGAILMLAGCADGLPEHGLYASLLRASHTPNDIIRTVSEPGYLAQDAWEVQVQANVQLHADVYLYTTGLSDDQVRQALITPCHDISATLDQLIKTYGDRVCVLPEGPLVIVNQKQAGFPEKPTRKQGKMKKYNKVTPDIVRQIAAIVGNANVIFGDEEKLEPYSHDEVANHSFAAMPEVVVKPVNADQISQIMRLANRENIPVTPRGAGSGLSGGAVPAYGGILLSVEKMNHILEVDTENLLVVVEPGVVTNEINEKLKEYNLFFAGYPMSVEACFVGGNVAENAGGGKAIKYGVTGRYIMGLEVVLPSGEIVQLGGKLVKDVAGYNLLGLMVGSEGTLGIFTKIFIKLLPLPTTKADLLVLFKTAEDAIRMVPRIMTSGGIIPTAIEFMDQLSVKTTCQYLNETLPYEKAGAMLLIEVDGTNREQVEKDYERIGDLCFENGAIEVYVAPNHTTQERIWAVRRNIAEAFKVYSPVQSLEDVVVPFASIPQVLPVLENLSKKYNVLIPCYGHAGDGNLHVTLVKKPEMELNDWPAVEKQVLIELYQHICAIGGSISGEHGIGSKRMEYLPIMLPETVIDLQRKIKLAFDPNLILNPGKIFSQPEEAER